MEAINPELRDLQREIIDIRLQIARQEGEIKQLRHSFQNRAWQIRWQLIAFALSGGGLLIALFIASY